LLKYKGEISQEEDVLRYFTLAFITLGIINIQIILIYKILDGEVNGSHESDDRCDDRVDEHNRVHYLVESDVEANIKDVQVFWSFVKIFNINFPIFDQLFLQILNS
jgi:hypothetical protein